MADAHANFAYSTVATAPSPATSGTTLVVAAGEGVLFPAVPFNATVWPTGAQPLSSNAEIVRVTNISTDTLTITRAQESTVARTVVVGDQIMASITKKTLTDGETMIPIYDSTLGSTAASFDITSIPATFKHLLLVLYLSSDRAAINDEVKVRFNNDSAANYDWQRLYAASATVTSFETLGTTAGWAGFSGAASGPANSFSGHDMQIYDYAGTVGYKVATSHGVHRQDAGSAGFFVQHGAALWKSTAAINRITVFPQTGPNWIAGSRATLYGQG